MVLLHQQCPGWTAASLESGGVTSSDVAKLIFFVLK
jgi:hypothetical protein